MSFYAVNIADLAGVKAKQGNMYPAMLMLCDLLTSQVIDCERGRLDGGALLLQVEPERIEAMLNLLRNGAGRLPKYHKNLLRIYTASKLSAKTWKRV